MSSRQIIPHAGGKITITPGPNRSYQLGFQHISSTHGMALYQLAVGHDGRPLAVVSAMGVGVATPPHPKPSILAFIISDAQQMWGRTCPQCRTYFRTKHISGMTVCPYCTFAEDSIYFLTDSQRRYARMFVEAVGNAIATQTQVVIDFEEVTDLPEWTYSEQQLQHKFNCSRCNVTTDILGEYGSCPSCGKRNSGGVFHRKMNDIEKQLVDANPDRRSELLGSTVSVFEAMANDLKKILVSIPCHPTRREQIARLNFQDIALAVKQLQNWYAFDLSKGSSAVDLAFVDIMFKRRHLFTHNAGRVDEKYLAETGDKTFQLHEAVVLSHEEMIRFLPLVRKLGGNLISDADALE